MPAHIVLPNNLSLQIEELPHTRSVSLCCFLGVGARHEPAALSGVSHLIEHMCFKGTRSLPTAHHIAHSIESIGGILEAETSYENTVYWSKVADIHFERALHVLTELVRFPRFEPADLDKERRVIIEELRGIQDDPDEWIDTLIYESFWGEQPLGRDVAGSSASVGSIGHQAMLAFWQQHYTAAQTVLAVAGNVRTERVIDALQQAFADYPAGERQQAIPTAAPVPGPRVLLQTREIEQSNFRLGLPGLSYNDPDRRALDVLDIVLGGGMASRLVQTLREERGLAYQVGSYHNKYADAGVWIVYASVEPESLYESIALTLDVLQDIAASGITRQELNDVKEQMKGQLLISLEDTWSVAARNGSLQLRYGHVLPIESVVAEFEAVTSEDVRRVAQRVLRRENLHLAVVGPHRDADNLHSLMEKQGI